MPNSNPKFDDTALLGVMEKRMKQSTPRKSGLEASVLSAIAEGDSGLVAAYNKLSIDSKSGAKALTPDIVETTVTKTKIDVDRLAGMIMKAQNVSICFLVDTTGSMTRYINAIKDQIVQMVNDIRASNCGIAGLSFVGYKDWSDGKSKRFFKCVSFYISNSLGHFYLQVSTTLKFCHLQPKSAISRNLWPISKLEVAVTFQKMYSVD